MSQRAAFAIGVLPHIYAFHCYTCQSQRIGGGLHGVQGQHCVVLSLGEAIAVLENDLYTTIISIIQTLPLAPLVLVLLIVAMVAFYATSFDSIALVASSYTYRQITGDEEPHNAVKAFWAIMLILLPMALVFSDSSMANLQSVSIIAAFPVAFVILLIIASFLKDASDYLKS